MWEIWPRIPSPKTIWFLYVMVNLINVKRTSIAVVVALIMLFFVRINVQVSKANTYAKPLPRLLYILRICVIFSQQPWRGSSAPENDSRYTSSIITDIAVWKIRSVGGLSIIYSLTPTRTSANSDHQSSLSIRNQIVQNIPAVMKYRMSVTRIKNNLHNESIGKYF